MQSSRVIQVQLPRKGRGANLANRHTRRSLEQDDSHANLPPGLKCIKPPQNTYFEGILIPRKPIPPSIDECCMSNCRPCVHDIYLSALRQFRKDIADIRRTLQQKNIPVKAWPNEIRPQAFYRPEEFTSIEISGFTSSVNEFQLDIGEMKAIETAQEAKKIMANRNRNTEKDISENFKVSSGTGMLLEAGKLVLWALRGCPG